MNPYYSDEFGTLYLGDSKEILPNLEPNSVDMAITSPPYWKARRYISDNELGQEPDFRDYINNLCKILDFVKCSLHEKRGSLFVNIGDKYMSKVSGSGGRNTKQLTNTGSFFNASKAASTLPDGSLVDIPGRFSIQMIDEWSWILKHRIIWYKPNAFVTSNKKKFTLDYELIYHFILDPKNYYFT